MRWPETLTWAALAVGAVLIGGGVVGSISLWQRLATEAPRISRPQTGNIVAFDHEGVRLYITRGQEAEHQAFWASGLVGAGLVFAALARLGATTPGPAEAGE